MKFETERMTTEFAPQMHAAVNAAVQWLMKGEIVGMPTETVYGLAADATDANAVAKIFEAKERPHFDPLIVHIADKKLLDTVADVPEDIAPIVKRLTERFWPGPLTILLPKKAIIPDLVTAGLPTVAVRVSSHAFFKRVITALNKPIAAPSANRFGSISPTSANAVVAELNGRIPLVVDAGACLHGLESTIIKLEAGSPKPFIHIIRPGPITTEELKLYGKVIVEKKQLIDEVAQAPGQLASHYAPKTPLRLLSKPSDFTPQEGKSYALLSYRGEESDGYTALAEWKQMMVLSPGNGKLPEAAVRFFYALRELDQCGADEIIAEPMFEHGVGVAMMDRLRRAAQK
jgi:L-threonylcarbamoyladenylate synthase